MKDEVSHRYKTTCKIAGLILYTLIARFFSQLVVSVNYMVSNIPQF
jgi:hypothetical protein